MVPLTLQDWQQALMLPEHEGRPLRESLFAEYAEYRGRSVEPVELAAIRTKERLFSGLTGDDLERAYLAHYASAPDHEVLLAWHAELGSVPERLWAANFALGRGLTRYLDFGSGIGTDAIVLAQHGFEVTLADISRALMDFAVWRLARRGIRAAACDLTRDRLPDGAFDFITSYDVLEHVPPALLPETLARVRAALSPEGVFFLTVSFDEDQEEHVTSRPRAVAALRRAGFSLERIRAERVPELLLCRRRNRPRAVNGAIGIYDAVACRVHHAWTRFGVWLYATPACRPIVRTYQRLKRLLRGAAGTGPG